MTEPPFETPWHAQAFALAHHLVDRGHITWPDWSDALSIQIACRPIQTADDYYTAWIAALETLINAPEALSALRDAWTDAHATTPHGQPVRLSSSFGKYLGEREGLAPHPDRR